uniref:Uncharacterized protein n=1 Tax=Phasianus colchicus TaxID=9054 RepID=A0A669QRZ5_PHACC
MLSLCKERTCPCEAVLVLAVLGSAALDGLGAFRGGGRKRGMQPAPSEETKTSPWLELKTSWTAAGPELTLTALFHVVWHRGGTAAKAF